MTPKGKQGKNDIYISSDQWGICKICKRWEDLRFGVCFDCATAAEKEAVLKGELKIEDSTLTEKDF